MQFNSTDKSISIVADIDFLLFGTGETFNSDYSIADRTRNVNQSLDEAVSELFKADPNFMWDDTTNVNFPIATASMVANEDHITIPDYSLVIHRVRTKDKNGNWKTLNPKLRRQLSDEQLTSTGEPVNYYKIDNALFFSPIPDYSVTSGVELEFQRGANHFNIYDTTKEPGFNPQFHEFLSISAALRYAIANGMKEKVNILTNEKERVRIQMRSHYQMRSPDERQRLSIKLRQQGNWGLS